MMNDGNFMALQLPSLGRHSWRWPGPAGWYVGPKKSKKARRKRKLAKASKKRNRR